MDPLSGVASVFAVASLALQLLQSVETVRTGIRNIKGASKELERLADLLDRLNALLHDVRDALERQTSLRHFPTPSNSLFVCLKSCETNLGLLDALIKKYGRSQIGRAAAITRLRDDIKFSFKTKDVTSFETRIQHDINELQTAFNTNTANILTTVLPVMLVNQEAILASTVSQQELKGATPPLVSSDTEIGSHIPPYISRCTMVTQTRRFWPMPRLPLVDIRQRRTVKYTSIPEQGIGRPAYVAEDVVSESQEVFVESQLLGYGYHWRQESRHKSILPSLRSYPVVDNIRKYSDLVCYGSVGEIQRAFTAGLLHPFTRDQDGNTLLHYAAWARRPDASRLLLDYGVEPEPRDDGITPLEMCWADWWYRTDYRDGDDIDTFRTLLTCSVSVERLELDNKYQRGWSETTPLHAATLEWLWVNAAVVFHGEELYALRIRLAKLLVKRYVTRAPENHNKEVVARLLKLLDVEMLRLYRDGGYKLLMQFMQGHSSVESHLVGEAFLELLTSSGLDVEACIRMELEEHPGGIIEEFYPGPNRKMIFEKDGSHRASLRWEWAVDPNAPGYDVLTEFAVMALDMHRNSDMDGPSFGRHSWTKGTESETDLDHIYWPFIDLKSKEAYFKYSEESANPLQASRLERRLANKARKERARSGQKRVRSKMPGTWGW